MANVVNVFNVVNGVPELMMGWVKAKTQQANTRSNPGREKGPDFSLPQICHPERSEGTDQEK